MRFRVSLGARSWLACWMERFVLTDAQWAKLEPHCLGKPRDPGRSGSDNRRFVEAVLWVVLTGSPWRDLPACFGHWNTGRRQVGRSGLMWQAAGHENDA